MANRLWSIGVPPGDELGQVDIVPRMRFINAEDVSRIYLDENEGETTWTLTLHMGDGSKVEFEYDNAEDATDGFRLWAKRVEYAGATAH